MSLQYNNAVRPGRNQRCPTDGDPVPAPVDEGCQPRRAGKHLLRLGHDEKHPDQAHHWTGRCQRLSARASPPSTACAILTRGLASIRPSLDPKKRRRTACVTRRRFVPHQRFHHVSGFSITSHVRPLAGTVTSTVTCRCRSSSRIRALPSSCRINALLSRPV